jgi:signal peptidase II
MDRPSLEPFRSPAAVARFVITMVAGLALDLWTKSITTAHLQVGEWVDVIPGWLRFDYTRNKGAVFGIAQGQRVFFLFVSAGAIVFLSYLFSASSKRPWYQIILGLLLAGVLGNMYDRIVFGYVRDMIHALPGWRWPEWLPNTLPFLPAEVFPWIFNVADSLLCIGVGLLLIYSFFNSPKAEPKQADALT